MTPEEKELEEMLEMLNQDFNEREVTTYDDAMDFLQMLRRQLPEWSYDDHNPVLDYIEEVMWRDNDMRNS